MYYGTPPIVTNGLVLNLDSLNTLSIPVDPTVNLLLWSQNFSQSIWNKGGATVTSITESAPDGTLTACLIDDTNAYLTPAVPTQVISSFPTPYLTVSFYTKKGTATNRTFLIRNSTTATDINPITFNYTSTGTLSNGWFSEDVGNGWFKLTATVTSSITPGNTIVFYWGRTSAAASGSTATWYMWNAQIESNYYATPHVLSTATRGTRNTWTNLVNLSQTASLLTGSISSSIPSFRSLKEGILTFDGSGSYSGINNIYSGYSSSATEIIFSLNQFVSSSGVTAIGGYDLNIDDNYYSTVGGLVYVDNITKKIQSSVITTSQTYRYVTSTTTLTTGSYYHVILNKDTTAGTLQLYVNGILESTNTFDTASYGQWPTTGSYVVSNNINIGNTRSTNANWTNTKYLSGKLPVFKLYNRVLSQNEVLQNYNAYKTRFNLT